jgi:hypothetical protein
LAVALNAGEAALAGPAAVAIHDDGDVPGVGSRGWCAVGHRRSGQEAGGVAAAILWTVEWGGGKATAKAARAAALTQYGPRILLRQGYGGQARRA